MMEVNSEKQKKVYCGKSVVLSAVAGAVVGALFCGVVVFSVMPSMMIVTSESNLGFDETVLALEKAIKDNSWIVSGIKDMNKSMAKHGVEFGPRVKLVELCHPEYAKSVLTSDRYISTMMPCKFGVWEGDDGKVYLSKMNMDLMAKMFGGNIAKVMGGNVVSDEEKILAGIVKN